MSKDFTKDLSPYEDNNHNPIRGQYHFDIPQDIEPNAYSMNIDYESHDDTHPDAYQYDGWIVIGHRPYFFAEPLIVPYNTLAVSEEAITSYEKFSTTFNAVVKTYSDSALTRVVKNLPYHLRVLKGQFKDYYADSDSVARTNIVNDYNTSSQLMNITMPQSSGSTGTGTTALKISDIYESSQTIQNYNTLFARCKGTRDRGTDNYVPGTVVIPLILGTTPVYIRSISSRTTMMDIDNNNEEDTVTTVCGSGTVKLDIDIFYQWAMRQDTQNNHMKYGYEDWRTDVNKQVRVGSIKLQTNINGTWEDVPKSLLSPANQYTTILDNGNIIHTPNTKGELEVYYTNPVDLGTTKTFKYRFVYTGKVGATFDNTSGELYCQTSPSYGTDKKVETKIFYRDGTNPNYTYLDSSNTIELFKGKDNDVTFKTYIKRGNEYVPVNGGLEGEIQYTFYGENGTESTSDIGVSTIHLPKDRRGIVLQMQYIPNSGNVQGCSTTFNIHYTPQNTNITLKGVSTDAQPQTTIKSIYINEANRLLINLTGTEGGEVITDPSKIQVALGRTTEENGVYTTLTSVNNVGTVKVRENNNYEVDGFNYNNLKTLIQNMISLRQCPFTSYAYKVKFLGNSDFLPAEKQGRPSKVLYTATDGDWDIMLYGSQEGDYLIDSAGDIHIGDYIPPTDPEGNGGEGFSYRYPESERSHVTIRHGDTLNVLIRVKGDYLHFGENGFELRSNRGLECLKTNIQFYDYVYPIETSTTTYPPRTPFEIMYTPGESGTIGVSSNVSDFDGRTDSWGRSTWSLKIPDSWSNRPNCEFRIRIQESSQIEMSTQEIIIPLEII